MGLQHVFDGASLALMPDPALQCRKTCYSILGCEYWQLHAQKGCFVEIPSVGKVEYPITTSSVVSPHSSRDWVAGEYIRRMCASVTTTTTLIEAFEGPWWGWWLIALGLVLVCGGILTLFPLLCRDKRPKRRTRSFPAEVIAPTWPQPGSTQHETLPAPSFTIQPTQPGQPTLNIQPPVLMTRTSVRPPFLAPMLATPALMGEFRPIQYTMVPS